MTAGLGGRLFAALGVLILILTGSNASLSYAGLLDALQVSAKADAPLEADQPGYQVILFDTHSDGLLIAGDVVIPASFGQVDGAVLTLIDPAGRNIGFMELAPGFPARKEPYFEFNVAREYLKNSTVAVVHKAGDTFDTSVIHVGTFGVRDLKTKPAVQSPPRVNLALAEQGILDDQGLFSPSDNVPLEEGQSFGFRLYFRGDGRSLPVRVEQTLPSPPKTWGDPETLKRLKISEDGRTASAAEPVATDKLFEVGWTVAEGDPAGDYVIKVFVRDELVHTFVFHVHPPPPPPGPPSGQPGS